MAVTFTFTEDSGGRQRVGRQHEVKGRLVLDGTYATGGFAVTAGDFGLGVIESLYAFTPWETTESYTAAWDSANSKIILGWGGGAVSSELDEITDTDDVSDVALDVMVRGR
jgi:hypothetical protein